MNLFPFHVKLYLICRIKGVPILVILSSFSSLGLLAVGLSLVQFLSLCPAGQALPLVAPQVSEKYLISCLFISIYFISFTRASLPGLVPVNRLDNAQASSPTLSSPQRGKQSSPPPLLCPGSLLPAFKMKSQNSFVPQPECHSQQ